MRRSVECDAGPQASRRRTTEATRPRYEVLSVVVAAVVVGRGGFSESSETGISSLATLLMALYRAKIG